MFKLRIGLLFRHATYRQEHSEGVARVHRAEYGNLSLIRQEDFFVKEPKVARAAFFDCL